MPLPLEDDQARAIRRIIEAAGFDVGQFTWKRDEEAQTLLHTPTGYRFSIYVPGRLRYYRMVYKPGAMAEGSSGGSIGAWEDVLRLVGVWLRNIKGAGQA